MCPQNLLRFGFDDNLDEIVLGVDRFAFGSIFVLVISYQDLLVSIFRYGLFLSQPYRCHLGIGEDRVRSSVIIHLHVLLQDSVIVDDDRFIVCNVFEQIFPIGVSDRPDTGLGRFEIVIDCEPSFLCNVHSRSFGMENLGCGASAGGDQNFSCGDCHLFSCGPFYR